MNQKTFLMVAGTVALGYGLAFIIAPGPLATIYGVDLTPAVAMMDRFFGITLVGLGAACWAAKEASPAVMRPFLFGVGVSNFAGLLVSAQATLAHTLNTMGWTTVLVYLALTAGCAYAYRSDVTALEAA